MEKPRIIVIVGPRGVGKDTILNRILEKTTSIQKIVTYATRQKREGETEGFSYNFTNNETFLEKVKSGDIFEYTQYHGYYRGMSKAVINKILENGKIAIVAPDVIGFRALNKEYPNKVVGIFLTAPKELIKSRLEAAGDANIKERLKDYELSHLTMNEHDHVVKNDGTVDEAANKVLALIGF